MTQYWCAEFVSFICERCGLVNPTVINRNSTRGKYVPGAGISCWTIALTEAGLLVKRPIPNALYTYEGPVGAHIGFIESVGQDTSTGGFSVTLDGNSYGGAVRRNTRASSSFDSKLIWAADLDSIMRRFGSPQTTIPIGIPNIPPPQVLTCRSRPASPAAKRNFNVFSNTKDLESLNLPEGTDHLRSILMSGNSSNNNNTRSFRDATAVAMGRNLDDHHMPSWQTFLPPGVRHDGLFVAQSIKLSRPLYRARRLHDVPTIADLTSRLEHHKYADLEPVYRHELLTWLDTLAAYAWKSLSQKPHSVTKLKTGDGYPQGKNWSWHGIPLPSHLDLKRIWVAMVEDVDHAFGALDLAPPAPDVPFGLSLNMLYESLVVAALEKSAEHHVAHPFL